MYDSPKAAHFVACDHQGRELHYADQRGLDARWLAAKYAEANGVDFHCSFRLRPKLADFVALLDACSYASAATGLRVKLSEDQLRRLREIAGEYTGDAGDARELQPAGVVDAH